MALTFTKSTGGNVEVTDDNSSNPTFIVAYPTGSTAQTAGDNSFTIISSNANQPNGSYLVANVAQFSSATDAVIQLNSSAFLGKGEGSGGGGNVAAGTQLNTLLRWNGSEWVESLLMKVATLFGFSTFLFNVVGYFTGLTNSAGRTALLNVKQATGEMTEFAGLDGVAEIVAKNASNKTSTLTMSGANPVVFTDTDLENAYPTYTQRTVYNLQDLTTGQIVAQNMHPTLDLYLTSFTYRVVEHDAPLSFDGTFALSTVIGGTEIGGLQSDVLQGQLIVASQILKPAGANVLFSPQTPDSGVGVTRVMIEFLAQGYYLPPYTP